MDTKTAINGGKELAALIIQYCAKDAGGNKNLQKYIDDMNSGNGVFKEQKEALKILSDAGTEMEDGAHALLDNFSRNTGDMEKVFTSFDGFAKDVRGVADANKTTTKQLEQLSDQIKAITKHTDEINDISEQTNLLSFNASIEAARAGEAGKGFRIIANEVKKLSDNTKKTSQEIAHMVETLGEQIAEFSDQNEQKTALLERLVKATEESKNILASIKNDSNSNSACTRNMLDLLSKNQESIEKVVSSVAKSEENNKVQVQQFADNASQNLVLFNDIISFSIEMDQIFKYLDKSEGVDADAIETLGSVS